MKDYRRYHPDEKKLKEYGFIKQDAYIYQKDLLEGEFYIKIIVDQTLHAKVYDSDTDEEYTNIYLKGKQGKFVQSVRQAYEECIEDILEKCFVYDYFIFPQSKRIMHHIEKEYHVLPECPFKKDDSFVFRHHQKWFGLIMHIDYSQFIDKKGEVECLNVKVPYEEVKNQTFVYPAFHMNKKHWISIILDDSVDDQTIMNFIHKSYLSTAVCEDWVIPASPKKLDLLEAFKKSDFIQWHQKGNIHKNNIVYIYYGVPYSAIMFKCIVRENDSQSMLLQLLKVYDPQTYPLNLLKKYHLKSVRSARHIPKELSEYIGNTDNLDN